MTSVAIYTRLSTDSGEQTATRRQQTACEAYAELRGWDVVEVYEDVDASAYRRRGSRPAYEQMLLAIRSKRIDGVVTWKLDRLARRSADFERFWELCEANDVFLSSAMEPIDTSSDLGLALVRILVAFATMESATSGARLRAKAEERARTLQPPGQTAYGIRKGWKKLEPEQAKMVREAASRIIAGDPIRMIVLDWNARGIKAFHGGKWHHATLRNLIVKPRLAGLVTYRGEIIGRGDFPAILDEETFNQVVEIVEGRRSKRPVAQPRPHLLTGALRCSYCGGTMTVRRHPHVDSMDFLHCPAAPRGCNRTSIRSSVVTPVVTEALFERLRRKNFGTINNVDWTGVPEGTVTEAFAELSDSLRALACDYYTRHEITRVQFLEQRDGLFAIAEARLGSGGSRPSSLRNVRRMPQLRRRWELLDLTEQQAILRTEMAYATILPAKQRGKFSDAGRIRITWADDLRAQQRGTAWMTTNEVATRLGITRQTVLNLRRKGVFRAERLGPSWMFHRHEIDLYAAQTEDRHTKW